MQTAVDCNDQDHLSCKLLIHQQILDRSYVLYSASIEVSLSLLDQYKVQATNDCNKQGQLSCALLIYQQILD